MRSKAQVQVWEQGTGRNRNSAQGRGCQLSKRGQEQGVLNKERTVIWQLSVCEHLQLDLLITVIIKMKLSQVIVCIGFDLDALFVLPAPF